MIKIYHEDPVFDEFTLFDPSTGKLNSISKEEFDSYSNIYSEIIKAKKLGVKTRRAQEIRVFTGMTSPTHTRFPRRIYFQITRKCNLRCPACFICADNKGMHVPTDSIFRIAKFMGENGLIEVRITGGEPTTHPDFIKIVNKFQKEGVYVSIATNGVFNKDILASISKLKNIWVICSIDGNRKTHNFYRPNSYDKIIENLVSLKKMNKSIRIRLTTVLTKRNMYQMDDLARIGKLVDAESITVIPLRPKVREKWVIREMVNAKEFEETIKSMVLAKKKHGINFTTTIETDFKKNICPDTIYRKRFACAAGREGTNVDYDHKKKRFLVYGCSYSPVVDLNANSNIKSPFLAGTFSHDDIKRFKTIWEDDHRWKIFRDDSIKSEKCRDCIYLKKNQCTGSCPIQNVDLKKIGPEGRALSSLKKQIIKTAEWYCYKKIMG